VTRLQGVHHRSKILIAGGGVAGLEAMLALRAQLGGTVEIELISAEPEFRYRPIAVAEPFGLGEIRRIDLAAITIEHDAHLRLAAVTAVDSAARSVRTSHGETLAYDFLIVAVGARQWPAIEGGLTFGGGDDREALQSLMRDVQAGRVTRVAFAAPAPTGWLLPLYELALFTAAWARDRDIPDVAISVLTHESRPLEAFGEDVSQTVEELLADAGITLLTGRIVRGFDGERIALRGAHPYRADAVIALPGLDGPRLHGLPQDEHGFILIDGHCAVRGVEHVWAAGDGTAFPIKQGGIAAQQADAAASAVAATLGAVPHAEPFRPVLRGMLLTGSEPRYMRAVAGETEVSFQPLWWPPSKIAGRYLSSYLAATGHHQPGLGHDELVDRSPGEETGSDAEAVADEQEAVDLLLELADANAKRGSYDFALKCLEAAEDVGGPLPAARQADRHAWSGLRRR
jgi:sulfide:quinone oxidoreductase